MEVGSGKTNAIEFLKRDHRAVESLFDELDRADDGIRPAQAIFAELRMTLNVHSQLEEEIFYPAVRDATADSRRLIDAAEEDHEQIELLLEDLADLDEDADEYHRLLRSLQQSVRAHVVMEESQLFREAERGLDEADLERLAGEMEALRDDLISRPPDERRIDGLTSHHS
jgi:hemerythrin superfamily protein